jgi:predicted nucleotidyltransferase
MIHLEKKYLDEVHTLLQLWVPNCEVWAFGSRVHKRGLKPYSDLDLALITEHPLDASLYGKIKEAFEESELPIEVDIVDWASLTDSFKEVIRQAYQRIQ